MKNLPDYLYHLPDEAKKKIPKRENLMGIYLHPGRRIMSTNRQWNELAKWIEYRDISWFDIYSVYTDFDTLLQRLRLFKYLWIYDFTLFDRERENKLIMSLKKKKVTLYTRNRTYQPSYWVFTEEYKKEEWYENRLKREYD